MCLWVTARWVTAWVIGLWSTALSVIAWIFTGPPGAHGSWTRYVPCEGETTPVSVAEILTTDICRELFYI